MRSITALMFLILAGFSSLSLAEGSLSLAEGSLSLAENKAAFTNFLMDESKLVNITDLVKLRSDLLEKTPKRFLIQLEDSEASFQFSAQLSQKLPLYAFSDRIKELKNRSSLLKQTFWSSFKPGFNIFKGENIIKDFSHLPAMTVRINSISALNSLLLNPQVKGIYAEEFFKPTLSQSLPLISQPFVNSRGAGGANTTVVVLDTGVNYTHSDFGNCTSPGVPAGCKVVYVDDIATDDGELDDNGHGTNVSATVLGTAPEAKLAVLDVFKNGSASSFDIISAINWTVSNQSTYNIVAMNLSLGDGSEKSAHCENYYKTYFQYARNVGILATISSGNDNHDNGISSPACNSNVISVGAVYDANVGGLSYGVCTDSASSADKVACFSNSGPILDILAPGALITAGGYTMAGTSMASPHVAGAVAVARSYYSAPDYTIDDIESMLKSSGPLLTDPKSGIQTHRLDLEELFQTDGSEFATPLALPSANEGSLNGDNQFATKEPSEPNHAGNTGGSSVWMEWQAPEDGTYTFDTYGSDFDTLLAIYSGTDISSLIEIASCDDAEAPETNCQISIQVTAGQTFMIAIDGKDGATGNFAVNWDYEPIPEEEEIPFLPPIGYLIFASIIFITGLRKQK